MIVKLFFGADYFLHAMPCKTIKNKKDNARTSIGEVKVKLSKSFFRASSGDMDFTNRASCFSDVHGHRFEVCAC